MSNKHRSYITSVSFNLNVFLFFSLESQEDLRAPNNLIFYLRIEATRDPDCGLPCFAEVDCLISPMCVYLFPELEILVGLLHQGRYHGQHWLVGKHIGQTLYNEKQKFLFKNDWISLVRSGQATQASNQISACCSIFSTGMFRVVNISPARILNIKIMQIYQ